MVSVTRWSPYPVSFDWRKHPLVLAAVVFCQFQDRWSPYSSGRLDRFYGSYNFHTHTHERKMCTCTGVPDSLYVTAMRWLDDDAEWWRAAAQKTTRCGAAERGGGGTCSRLLEPVLHVTEKVNLILFNI